MKRSKNGIIKQPFSSLALLAVAVTLLFNYAIDNSDALEDTQKTVDLELIMSQLRKQLAENAFDPNSFAQPDQAFIDHIHLELKLDFPKKIFSGKVVLNCTKVAQDAKFLTLDSLDLNITSVVDHSGKNVKFEVFEAVPEFGSKVEIDISSVSSKHFLVTIEYQTSDHARGLQWLNKEQSQTELPFMFSQFEAINARSFLPCQDTPSVKASYSASVSFRLLFSPIFQFIFSLKLSRHSRFLFVYFRLKPMKVLLF